MKFGMGQSVKRKEDNRFLAGAGRYMDDINLDGQAYAYILRSSVPAAKITAVDTTEAKAAPGVLAVFTAADLEADGVNALPCTIPLKNIDGSSRYDTDRYPLARRQVRYVGDPIAMVVAESYAAARDAAELIDLDLDELDHVTDLARAAEPGMPRVWDDCPDNTCFLWERGKKAETEAAFAKARHVVPFEIVNNRIVVNSMEPRGAMGDYEADGDRMVLYVGSQGANNMRRILAGAVFNVPEDKMRIVTPDVGGGFGMKIFTYHEYALVMFAARRLKRPVKWTPDRSESFVSDTQGRDNITRGEIALDENAKFLGLRIETTANLGAYLSTAGALIPTGAGTRVLGCVYDFPAAYVQVRGVFTNTVPVDAYRGAGRPENIYITERAVDHAAAALNMDPSELRRRNYLSEDQLPYVTAMGETIDSGQFERHLDILHDTADIAGFPARKAESESRGKLRGLGLISYMEATAGAPQERAEIRFNDDDTVTVFAGTQSNGQGHETAFAQVVSEHLGIDFERVNVVMGDTDKVKEGFGTGGSRSLLSEGSAIIDASGKIIEKGKKIAGQLLETAVEDIEFGDGDFRIAGTDRKATIFEVARAARDEAKLPEGVEPGLDEEGWFKGDCTTFPNGAHACELEIDPDTGVVEIVKYTVVDDLGRLINPMLVAGQVHGGIAQGAGQALFENAVYDNDSGQLVSGSFMDYTMPRAQNFPDMDITFNQDAPTRNNILGVKGCGEAGAVGAPPCVIQAVSNALGVTHIDMPATPEKIWQILQQRQNAAA
jgi:carbon-monoxide dehydrogenase large subunit